MYALLIFLALMLSLLLYLLFAPINLEVNSIANLYQLRFHKIASANFNLTNETLRLDLRILGWHHSRKLGAHNDRAPKQVGKKKTRTFFSMKKVLGAIRSFRLKRCYVSVDTGDMAVNGILYPWIWWFGRKTKADVTINFCDRNEVILEIENNVFRVLRGYVLT